MCLSIIVNHPEVLIEKGLYQNYEWVITHNNGGYRCGYIQLNKDDPWFGEKNTLNIFSGIHGGITFSEVDKPCDKGGLDDKWWIGMDCNHSSDKIDESLPILYRRQCYSFDATIKTTEFVKQELYNLVDQVIKQKHINNYEYTIHYN